MTGHRISFADEWLRCRYQWWTQVRFMPCKPLSTMQARAVHAVSCVLSRARFVVHFRVIYSNQFAVPCMPGNFYGKFQT